MGVAFCVSLGMNVYFWRVRRTPQTGEKYSPSTLQVDAPQSEQGLFKQRCLFVALLGPICRKPTDHVIIAKVVMSRAICQKVLHYVISYNENRGYITDNSTYESWRVVVSKE